MVHIHCPMCMIATVPRVDVKHQAFWTLSVPLEVNFQLHASTAPPPPSSNTRRIERMGKPKSENGRIGEINLQSPAVHLVDYSTSCPGDVVSHVIRKFQVGFSAFSLCLQNGILDTKSYPRNRPWRPIRLWDVKDRTLSRQSGHRWR
jgi:hypothetical protein